MSTETSSHSIREWLSTVLDPDVFAVQEEEDMAREIGGIDELIEQVDRELADEARAEELRVSRDYTDEIRARRASRRAERTVLRSLPLRRVAASEFGEAA